MRHHFDWKNAILRDQQYGPMIVNVSSPNPRHHDHGNAYGQGFLAGLYADERRRRARARPGHPVAAHRLNDKD